MLLVPGKHRRVAVSQYLGRLGLVLTTVPSHHSEGHLLRSAWSPLHSGSCSWCCTETLLRMTSSAHLRGRGSPMGCMWRLKGIGCWKPGQERKGPFLFQKSLLGDAVFPTHVIKTLNPSFSKRNVTLYALCLAHSHLPWSQLRIRLLRKPFLPPRLGEGASQCIPKAPALVLFTPVPHSFLTLSFRVIFQSLAQGWVHQMCPFYMEWHIYWIGKNRHRKRLVL